MDLKTMSALFRYHYFEDEGWHRLYKKYGSLLSRENYRWKRKVMKRFGPNRAMNMRALIRSDYALLGKSK